MSSFDLCDYSLGTNQAVFVNRTGVRRFVVTYQEFHDLALKMTNLLAQNGVAPGDRVFT